MTTRHAYLAGLLAQTARGELETQHERTLSAQGIETLDAARDFLEQQALPIQAVERVEDLVKQTLLQLAVNIGSLAAARELALGMKRLGFFHKLKSYAIKAASPLGYSVFFQRPGEGFSFQRHLTHKVEIFQILSAPAKSFAFVCDHEAWAASYDPGRFQAWLNGADDPAYERFRFIPEPGDLIVIDRLNTVHTVIGCVLEEFATISTDLVDRLFDQNVGRPIPPDFPRSRVNRLLATLPEVEPQRVVTVGLEGLLVRPHHPETHDWGELRLIKNGVLTAQHLLIRPGAETDLMLGEADTTSLFVRAGHGKLVLEADREPSVELELAAGELTLVPAFVKFRLRAGTPSTLRVSLQSLPLQTALGPTDPASSSTSKANLES